MWARVRLGVGLSYSRTVVHLYFFSCRSPRHRNKTPRSLRKTAHSVAPRSHPPLARSSAPHPLGKQESLVNTEGFKFKWSLGLLEAVGVLAGSMLERAHNGEYRKRVAPFRSYVLLAGLLGMSSSLSNMALSYIKYPTKVSFFLFIFFCCFRFRRFPLGVALLPLA